AAHSISAIYGGNANFESSTSSAVSQSVAPATASFTVVGYSGVYDGHAHGATGSAQGVNGEDLSDGLNFGSSFMNVPGGTANWTFSHANYAPVSASVNIEITPATASFAVVGYSDR